ncbi:MAG: hypothetical protein ACRD2T_03665, partial [Thermoanaerobaculia bacterium]
MPRNLIFYLAVILVFGAGIVAILQAGSDLRPAAAESELAPLTPETAVLPRPVPDGAAAGFAAVL